MREMLTAADTGKLGRVDTIVGHVLERWFEQAQSELSPDTVTETKSYLDRTVLPGIGHLPLPKLGPAEVDRFYLQLRTNGGPGGQQLTPASIRRIHEIIHRALAQAVTWGWLTSNPASNASPPAPPFPGITPPTRTPLTPFLDETGSEMAMSTAGSDDQGVRRLPSREETLARGRPFPPYGELVIPGLTDEEERDFLNAIAEA